MQGEQFDKAQQALEQVLPMVRGGADKSAEANILSELAYVTARDNDTQQAEGYLQQVLPMLEAIGDKEMRARTLHNVALTYHSTGEMEKALDYYRQTLTVAQESGINNWCSMHRKGSRASKRRDKGKLATKSRHAISDRDVCVLASSCVA
jgi:tetratricopeptide (TPR) repeat protein